MDILIILWTFFSVPLLIHTSWVEQDGGSYVVGDVVVDFVTSTERCFSMGAHLAIFPVYYDFSDFVIKVNLKPLTRYWISASEVKYFTGSCISLSIQAGHQWVILQSNCSSRYQYICQRSSSLDKPGTHSAKSTFLTTTHTPALPQSKTRECCGQSTGVVISTFSKLVFPHKTETLKPSTDFLEPSFQSGIVSSLKTVVHFETSSIFSGVPVAQSVNTFDMSNVMFTPTPELHQSQSKLSLQTKVPTCCEDITALCRICSVYFKNNSYLTGNNTIMQNNTSAREENTNNTLVMDRRSTNKYKRQKTSAGDSRSSSKAMGVAAILIIAAVLLIIMVMDLPVLLRGIRGMMGDHYRSLNI